MEVPMIHLRLKGLGELEYSYGLEPLPGGRYRVATWRCTASVVREVPEHSGNYVTEVHDSGVHRNLRDVVTGFVPKVPGKSFEHDYGKRTDTPQQGYCPILGREPGVERATLMEIVNVSQ